MNKKIQYLILFSILALGFLVRLYKINNPVADWHSWRQADTSAVTRNFVKFGVDVLHPRFDDFSDTSGKGLFNPQGYRFVEFPIFNVIHFFVYTLFAKFYTLEYWGRMTSILAALTSAALLFFIVRRRSTPNTALLAAFFYLTLPYNIYFTRVILPDPLMVTLFLAALNFNDLKYNFLTVLFGSLAILVKPMAIFFLLPIYLSNFWLGLVMLIPFGAWRLWSYRYPAGVPASIWLLNGNHIRFKGAFFQWIFGERLGTLILGKWGVFPFVTGLLSSSKYFFIWIIGTLLYLFTFATGNVQHDYYQLPIIPIVSVLLAIGTNILWKNWRGKIAATVCILFMLAFAWYDMRGDFQVNNGAMLRAAAAVDQITPQDAIIVATYNGDSAFLYNTKRRGFTNLPLPIKDLRDRWGVTYYVSTTLDSDTKAIVNKYTVVQQTPEYVIVEILEPWELLKK